MTFPGRFVCLSQKMLIFASATARLYQVFYKSQTSLHVNVGAFSYLG